MTRLIDADKLYPDCLTKNGRVAISASQIASAPTVEARTKDNWIPISERLPEEKFSGGAFGFDFEEVLCTTIWEDVRTYKFGKPIGHDKPHFWLGGGIMDEYVIAWQEKPEPYKEVDDE